MTWLTLAGAFYTLLLGAAGGLVTAAALFFTKFGDGLVQHGLDERMEAYSNRLSTDIFEEATRGC
jgi:hypothetical protein